jgi:hypothetical protein
MSISETIKENEKYTCTMGGYQRVITSQNPQEAAIIFFKDWMKLILDCTSQEILTSRYIIGVVNEENNIDKKFVLEIKRFIEIKEC